LSETEAGAKLELILKDESALASVINLITQKNIKILRLSKREPTLEDVFMELVGRRMEDVEQEEGPNGK
jgi:ABC-2 type transport system ATP-binding protein